MCKIAVFVEGRLTMVDDHINYHSACLWTINGFKDTNWRAAGHCSVVKNTVTLLIELPK